MWYAGIDWANDHHDVVVIDEHSRPGASQRVPHTKAGVEELTKVLEGILGAAPKEQLACVIETNRGLLITALLEAGFPVSPVHPKTLDRRRVASGAKTDRIDAYLLAKVGRSELADLRRLEPDSPTIAELKALPRDQQALIQMQTSLAKGLTACLKAYSPVALTRLSQVHQRSTLVFLQTFSTPHAALTASPVELAQVLKAAGHPPAKKVAPKIYQALHQPQRLSDPVTTRTKARLALVRIGQLLPLIGQIATDAQDSGALFLTHPDSGLFASLPRAGRRLAPRLLAELGEDRARSPDARSLQALAGTAPVLYQSGNDQKAHRRSACLKPLRNTLYLVAWPSTRSEPWALDSYQRKRKEGKRHSVAVRALSNLWLRILYAMWTSRTPYQRARFENARLQHAPRAA